MANDIEESPTTTPKGPPGLTVYPASLVKDHGPNDTGIYFPEKYVPGASVDLLVYFHGLPAPCGGHNSDRISELWGGSCPRFPLRELVNRSGKNVVLVAPRLRGVEGSGLHLDMAADEFLTKVVAFIADRVTRAPFKRQGAAPSADRKDAPAKDATAKDATTKDATAMSIGKLILAAHSGGGTPMLRMAQTAKVAKVSECWGFDSMYGRPREWVDWAAQGGKYFLFWTTQGAIDSDKYGKNVTTIQSVLKKSNLRARKKAAKDADASRAATAAPNINIVYAPQPDDAARGFAVPPGRAFTSSTSKHCLVPATYWADMMSSF